MKYFVRFTSPYSGYESIGSIAYETREQAEAAASLCCPQDVLASVVCYRDANEWQERLAEIDASIARSKENGERLARSLEAALEVARRNHDDEVRRWNELKAKWDKEAAA